MDGVRAETCSAKDILPELKKFKEGEQQGSLEVLEQLLEKLEEADYFPFTGLSTQNIACDICEQRADSDPFKSSVGRYNLSSRYNL